jgi:hypothetical protein
MSTLISSPPRSSWCPHHDGSVGTGHQLVRDALGVGDGEDIAWKPADSFLYGHTRYIRISSEGYKYYGWDVMTSVLIHEFGHCALFAEGIGQGSSWEANQEIEKMANQRGLSITPAHLIPEHYQWHRDFFLKSYLAKGWNQEMGLEEWKTYQDTYPP